MMRKKHKESIMPSFSLTFHLFLQKVFSASFDVWYDGKHKPIDNISRVNRKKT